MVLPTSSTTILCFHTRDGPFIARVSYSPPSPSTDPLSQNSRSSENGAIAATSWFLVLGEATSAHSIESFTPPLAVLIMRESQPAATMSSNNPVIESSRSIGGGSAGYCHKKASEVRPSLTATDSILVR